MRNYFEHSLSVSFSPCVCVCVFTMMSNSITVAENPVQDSIVLYNRVAHAEAEVGSTRTQYVTQKRVGSFQRLNFIQV